MDHRCQHVKQLWLIVTLAASAGAKADKPEFLWNLPAISAATQIAVDPSGQYVSLCTPTRRLLFTPTGDYVRYVPTYNDSYRGSFNSTGTQILSHHYTGNTFRPETWNTDGSGRVRQFTGLSAEFGDLVFIPGTQRFLYAQSSRIGVADAVTGNVVGQFNGGPRFTFASANGQYIAGGGPGSVASVYAYPGGASRGTYDCGSPIRRLAVRNQGDFLYTVSQDTVLRIWDLQSQQLLGYLPGYVQMALSSDQQSFVALAANGTSCDVYSATGTFLRQIPVSAATDVAISADMRWLYTSHTASGLDRLVRRDFLTGAAFPSTPQLRSRAYFYKWVQDKSLAVFEAEDQLLFLDPDTGDVVRRADTFDPLNDVSNDGTLAVTEGSNMMTVFDLVNNTVLFQLPKYDSAEGDKFDAGFSADSQRLVIVGYWYDHDIQSPFRRIWNYDPRTGQRISQRNGNFGRYEDFRAALSDGDVIVYDSYWRDHLRVTPTTGTVKWQKGYVGGIMAVDEARGQYATGTTNVANVYSLTTGLLERTVTVTGVARAISPDFSVVASTGSEGDPLTPAIYFSDATTGVLLHKIDDQVAATSVEFLASGESFLTTSTDFVSCIRYPGRTTATVVPDSVTIKLGLLTGGTVANLAVEDGAYLTTQKFFVPNASGPSISLEVESTNPLGTLSGLSATCAIRMDTAGVFEHRVELWDFVAGRWDPVDTVAGAVTPNTNTRFVVTATGNVSRYAHPFTKRLRARLTLTKTGQAAAFVFSTRHDLFLWTVHK